MPGRLPCVAPMSYVAVSTAAAAAAAALLSTWYF